MPAALILLSCFTNTDPPPLLAEAEIPQEDAATRRFREWCRASEIDVHPDIRIGVQTPRAARGVVAAVDFEAGMPVLAVPMKSMLTAEHAFVDERFASLWDALPDLPDSDLLAAYVASREVREKSSHAGYLAYLPREARDALHLGPQAMALLKASPVYPRLESRRNKLEEVGRWLVVGRRRATERRPPARSPRCASRRPRSALAPPSRRPQSLKDIVVAAGKSGHHAAVHRLRHELDMCVRWEAWALAPV